jgi:hypothetical protein
MAQQRLTLVGTLVFFALALAQPQTAPKTNPKSKTTKKAGTTSGLTVQQIERLIAIQTPDQVISGEVQSRGVSGELDRAIIEKLRSAGAGPTTLAALVELIPKVGLKIHTAAGATVWIDGQQKGVSDANGSLSVGALEIGAHNLRITKQFFRDHLSRVRVAADNKSVLEVPLEWAIGFLTVRTSPPDATVTISGADQAPLRVTELPLSIGEHTVSASAPYREPISRAIRIEGGKSANVDLDLQVDKTAVQRLHREILELATSGNDGAVIREAHLYHYLAGPDAQVLNAAGRAYLHTKSYSDLVPTVIELLASGGSFSFSLIHDHIGLALRTSHPASLTFLGSKLQYRPEGSCNTKEFTASLADARMETRLLRLNYLFLTLWVPNPTNDKKELTMNFLDSDPELMRTIANIAGRIGRSKP